MVSEKGREPNLNKVAMIDGLATPTNAKGLAKLLGHIGGYKELILDFAKKMIPITRLLRKDCRFEWTVAC